MKRFGYAAAGLLMGLGLGAAPLGAQGHEGTAPPAPGAPTAPAPAPAPAPGPAPVRAPTPLEAAFDAAELGDLGPLRRALSGVQGDEAAVIRGRLALARLDPAPADPALARIAAGRDPALRMAALSVLAADAFLRGAYAEAARWGRALGEAQAAHGDAEGAGQSEHQWQVAALLAGHPAQTVEGRIAPHTVAARTDRVGLPRIDVAVNGQAQEAVFDSGASLSVLSTETARRLGVTVITAAPASAMASKGWSPSVSASPTGWRSPAPSCATSLS
jgi:hypothetical protein